jgi:deazaflavin-dependent oxidoreductase (nitroreductase family)
MVGWVTRLVAPLVQAIDRPLLAWSGDRLSITSGLTGMPVARVTTTGARSGKPRTHPLTVLRDGQRLALVGSNFGRRCLPAWCHNLRVHGVAQIHTPAGVAQFTARFASPAEYEAFWQQAVELYPGYAAYAQRAAPRTVPIFVLTRVERD